MIEALESRCMLSAVRFAVIGDYGSGRLAERQVADLVKSWRPDLVITTGDNNYPSGSAATIDRRIGFYYQQFIYPYRGRYGTGAIDGINRFFPSLGNHDWYSDSARPYLDYFTLPGNERFYTFTRGPVQFFVLDSYPEDPDLHYVDARTSTATGRQGRWLRRQLAASTATWKIVYFHHPPYSSGTRHGSALWMRWPFRQWGATAVIAGHEHNYERLVEGGMPYFVNGSGGDERYAFGRPLPGSKVRFNADFGAMLVDADDGRITFRFITRAGALVDRYTIRVPA